MTAMLDLGLGTRLVLCYHGVSPTWPADPTVRPDRLGEQVELLQRRGWRGLTLSDALRAPQRQKVFVVTFDDAHLSVYDLARGADCEPDQQKKDEAGGSVWDGIKSLLKGFGELFKQRTVLVFS